MVRCGPFVIWEVSTILLEAWDIVYSLRAVVQCAKTNRPVTVVEEEIDPAVVDGFVQGCDSSGLVSRYWIASGGATSAYFPRNYKSWKDKISPSMADSIKCHWGRVRKCETIVLRIESPQPPHREASPGAVCLNRTDQRVLPAAWISTKSVRSAGRVHDFSERNGVLGGELLARLEFRGEHRVSIGVVHKLSGYLSPGGIHGLRLPWKFTASYLLTSNSQGCCFSKQDLLQTGDLFRTAQHRDHDTGPTFLHLNWCAEDIQCSGFQQ